MPLLFSELDKKRQRKRRSLRASQVEALRDGKDIYDALSMVTDPDALMVSLLCSPALVIQIVSLKNHPSHGNSATVVRFAETYRRCMATYLKGRSPIKGKCFCHYEGVLIRFREFGLYSSHLLEHECFVLEQALKMCVIFPSRYTQTLVKLATILLSDPGMRNRYSAPSAAAIFDFGGSSNCL